MPSWWWLAQGRQQGQRSQEIPLILPSLTLLSLEWCGAIDPGKAALSLPSSLRRCFSYLVSPCEHPWPCRVPGGVSVIFWSVPCVLGSQGKREVAFWSCLLRSVPVPCTASLWMVVGMGGVCKRDMVYTFLLAMHRSLASPGSVHVWT